MSVDAGNIPAIIENGCVAVRWYYYEKAALNRVSDSNAIAITDHCCMMLHVTHLVMHMYKQKRLPPLQKHGDTSMKPCELTRAKARKREIKQLFRA